ncbi:MAG TPA: phospholipase A, partial [bacterium]|nr:phospholipase A [bacterium]
SWNRAYLQTLLLWEGAWDTQLSLKYWQRYPESPKANPLDASGDDNPDIQDYLGYGEAWAEFTPHSAAGASPSQRVRLFLRQGSIAHSSTVQLDYDYQLHDWWQSFTPGWYLHVQYFYGYGESLIDYNRLEKKLALGLSVR